MSALVTSCQPLRSRHRSSRSEPRWPRRSDRTTAASADDLGLQELGVDDGVLAIEWPERLARSVAGSISIRLEPIDGEADTWRRVTITRL